MDNKRFKLINSVVGCVILVVSAIVYLMTIEPTASFWDCGEFIASSYKLEVGHPPGNPVFQLFARFFTMFVDNTHAAAAVNCCSAICSAFTIFFLYLTIVHFGRRILEKSGKSLTVGNVVSIIGSGVAGSLAYCFSDTFWFSAVEGEVYAMSSLFTAVVFWAILKWEEEADAKYADRWIVLICFLMGLSIGVHLLNLLAIPPIVFIYYYKKHEKENISIWKSILVLAISAVILAVVLFGIIPYLPKVIAFVDRIFVNGFGAPFNLGAAIFMILLFAALFLLMSYFRKKEKATAHTVTLGLTTIVIGYSVFAIVIIRASANTPTNEYQPDNAYTLIRYLGREQYGSNPLIYGEAYTSELEAKSSTYYTKLGDRYVETAAPLSASYPAGAKMFFPRMWSTQSSNHTNFYDTYTAVHGLRTNRVRMSNGEYRINKMPKMSDNLAFFFDYQVGYMYFRYFMWNFVGRQNDFHGQIPGDKLRGNWESGIGFIDKARLGDQSVGPKALVENKAKNHYYFLPLILGLIGFFFQMKRDGRNSWITSLLFLLTGIAIIIYLNQPPYQVRERDYAYAGSFYVFAIWIGLAVMWLKELFDKVTKRETMASAAVASALCVAVAILMGCENWDDHDRSHRYTARDLAYNYLVNCDPQSILITHGDNDTFPLWYSQEVEGVRKDVRIMNTSLLGMDWYIDQMKWRCNESDPLDISLPREDYLYGTNDFVRVLDNYVPLKASDVMAVFKDPQYRDGRRGGIVTHDIEIPVNKENAVKYGIVAAKDVDKMVDTVHLHIDGSSLSKTDLIILDLLSNYQWDRAIYFVSQNGDCDFSIGKYLQFDGFIYKFVPIECPRDGVKQQDHERLYDMLMNKYKFDSNMDPRAFVDYQNLYTFCAVSPLRELFVNTAEAFYEVGENKKCVELLDRAFEVTRNYPLDLTMMGGLNEYLIVDAVDYYFRCGEPKKAYQLAKGFTDEVMDGAKYYSQMVGGSYLGATELRRELSYCYYMCSLLEGNGYEKESKEITEKISGLLGK